MPSNEFLFRRQGQKIEECYIEFLRSEEGSVSLFGLVLKFSEGKPLILGCSGDGGIFSVKSKLQSAEISDLGEISTQPLPLFAGAILEKVLTGPERLQLLTSSGGIQLVNIGDEMTIQVGGDSVSAA
mgnify:CR=1 FL=1